MNTRLPISAPLMAVKWASKYEAQGFTVRMEVRNGFFFLTATKGGKEQVA